MDWIKGKLTFLKYKTFFSFFYSEICSCKKKQAVQSLSNYLNFCWSYFSVICPKIFQFVLELKNWQYLHSLNFSIKRKKNWILSTTLISYFSFTLPSSCSISLSWFRCFAWIKILVLWSKKSSKRSLKGIRGIRASEKSPRK